MDECCWKSASLEPVDALLDPGAGLNRYELCDPCHLMSTVRLKTACAVIFLQLDIDFGCMLLESFQQDSEDPEGLPTSPKN